MRGVFPGRIVSEKINNRNILALTVTSTCPWMGTERAYRGRVYRRAQRGRFVRAQLMNDTELQGTRAKNKENR